MTRVAPYCDINVNMTTCGFEVSLPADDPAVPAVAAVSNARWSSWLKVWIVPEQRGGELVIALAPHAHRTAWHPRHLPVQPVEVMHALLTIVGTERADAVFKALAKTLHPDTATGDADLMRALNAARDHTKTGVPR